MSAGASDLRGEGEGAGGNGNGTGGGGWGAGDTPPRQIKGRLTFSDLPNALRELGTGGTVAVRYDVNASGGVSGCIVTASSGNAELDRATCQLIQQRFRFKPARDGNDRPVAATIEERHIWEIEEPGVNRQ